MAIDLRPARSAVERIMSDRCVIRRDTENVYDDVLNPTTLELAPPVPGDSTVYSGQCLIGAVQRSETELGGQYLQANRYSVKIPHTAPVVKVGDLIEITASIYDVQLVGVVMVVREVVRTSLLVWRRLIADDTAVVPL